MIPKNPGIAQKGIQKSGSNPQKSTQNIGTSTYHNICKLPPRVFNFEKFLIYGMFVKKLTETSLYVLVVIYISYQGM